MRSTSNPLLVLLIPTFSTLALAVPPVPNSPEPTTKAARAQATSQPAILNPTYPPDFAEAERAIKRFKPASGLTMSVFAAEPQLQNPVSLHIDDKNRFWVCETFRFDGGGEGDGVYDIRHRYHLLDDDLASKTVEQRLAVINKWNDGDLSKLTLYPDRLKLIEDKNSDGRADSHRVIAQWQQPLDGLASGAITRGDDVYVTNIPDLLLLSDKDKDGKYDQKTLSTGYGVRYSLLGHDLHGLRWGPDGKLYFSVGDRGMSVKTREGKLLDLPDEGVVMRCDKDGSNLEVFATGLRNPQKLAFDKYGNLFTGDNNCDHGDPARWVYVVEGGDTGWRIGYQHIMTPRATGPWKQENLYALEADNTAAYVIPPIAHIGSGPSGITYYPGTSLPAKYDDHFFMTDFRAGPSSSVMSFKMKPKGASFELVEKAPFVTGIVPTDVEFGPEGGAYISDWIGGFPKTGKGRIYRVIAPDAQQEKIVGEVAKILKIGMSGRKPAELVGLLGHVDMRVRQGAQFELAERKLAAVDLDLLTRTALKSENQMSRIHAIRALGQIGRKDQKVLPPLVALLEDADEEVRVQAIKTLGEARVIGAYDQLVRLIGHASPRVRYFAAINVGRYERVDAIAPLLSLLAKNDNQDKYLRHAAVMGLTYIGDRSALMEAAKYKSPAARMGVLLAMRRLQMPEVRQFLNDRDVALVVEAARAINDTLMEPARPALAAMLLKPRPSTRRAATTAPAEKWPEPLVHRALNAHFRLGNPENAQALAQFAAQNDADDVMRIEALAMLQEWESPRGIDRVTGNWHPLPRRDAAIAREGSQPVIAQIIQSAPDTVRIAAIELLKTTGTHDNGLLFGVVTANDVSPDVATAALTAMDALNDARLADAVDRAIREGRGSLRGKAIELLSRRPDAVSQLEKLLADGDVADQQAVLTALGKIESQASDAILSNWMDRLLGGAVAPEVKLDLLEAAAESKSEVIKNKVKAYDEKRPKNDALAAFREATVGGDASAGRKIFYERADVSCLRCHKIDGEGGVAGPDLSGVALTKTRDYLLESILDPNRAIAPGFEAVTVKVKAGTSYVGVVKADTDSTVVIDAGDGATVHIDKKEVATRTKGLSPMPQDIAKPLSKRDVRNLVEFLATLKQPTTQPIATPQQASRQ